MCCWSIWWRGGSVRALWPGVIYSTSLVPVQGCLAAHLPCVLSDGGLSRGLKECGLVKLRLLFSVSLRFGKITWLLTNHFFFVDWIDVCLYSAHCRWIATALPFNNMLCFCIVSSDELLIDLITGFTSFYTTLLLNSRTRRCGWMAFNCSSGYNMNNMFVLTCLVYVTVSIVTGTSMAEASHNLRLMIS